MGSRAVSVTIKLIKAKNKCTIVQKAGDNATKSSSSRHFQLMWNKFNFL